MKETICDANNLESRGIYKRYQNITFDNVIAQGVPVHFKEQFKSAQEYAQNIEQNLREGVGVIFKGGVGTLKTTLAIAILRHQLEKNNGVGGLFVPMSSLLDNIFTLKARSTDEWLAYEQKLRTIPLLVLDDLGAEYHQEWVLSKVDSIVTERYNRMKPIIITTNLTAAELKGKYAERIIDRLKSTSKQVNFNGKSLRKEVCV